MARTRGTQEVPGTAAWSWSWLGADVRLRLGLWALGLTELAEVAAVPLVAEVETSASRLSQHREICL